MESYNYYNDNGTYRFTSTSNGYSSVTIELGKPNNMIYIMADNSRYCVASRSVGIESTRARFFGGSVEDGYVYSNRIGLCRSGTGGGFDDAMGTNRKIRPCIVLSSEIPWNDIKYFIENYETY